MLQRLRQHCCAALLLFATGLVYPTAARAFSAEEDRFLADPISNLSFCETAPAFTCGYSLIGTLLERVQSTDRSTWLTAQQGLSVLLQSRMVSLTVSITSWHYRNFFMRHMRDDECEQTV